MENSTVSQYKQIRAVYDADTVRVYQAFSCAIAKSACDAQHFVSPPFSMSRMTWIKPSFLWMMYRCGCPGPWPRLIFKVPPSYLNWVPVEGQPLDTSGMSG